MREAKECDTILSRENEKQISKEVYVEAVRNKHFRGVPNLGGCILRYVSGYELTGGESATFNGTSISFLEEETWFP